MMQSTALVLADQLVRPSLSTAAVRCLAGAGRLSRLVQTVLSSKRVVTGASAAAHRESLYRHDFKPTGVPSARAACHREIIFRDDWQPTGAEGAVDTNRIPWILVGCMPKCTMKPLRASTETGAFSAVIRMPRGVVQPTMVYLGSAETLILSGEMTHTSGPWKGAMGPGTWAYAPAGSKMRGTKAEKDTEFLAHFYGPVAFLDEAGKVSSILTAADVARMAHGEGIQLAPNTLAEAMHGDHADYEGPATPLRIVTTHQGFAETASDIADSVELQHPHYVDTNTLPWIVDPAVPQVGIKILRVSAETGATSLLVRQDHLGAMGEGMSHYHLAPADLFILSGGVKYGLNGKFGPGTYIWEPAGARHESRQRVVDDHLMYMSNIYGPMVFDDGVGTPAASVLSWITYAQLAEAKGTPLVASRFPNDSATFVAHEIS